MKFRFFLIFAACLFASAELDAQSRRVFPTASPTPEKVFPVMKENYVSAGSDEIFTVGKVTGDIGKAEALYLPKPFYPGEAKQDAADGKIYVCISIDETGNVTSAKSTDGHPALQKIAEETAFRSKFRAPIVDNQAVKSEGWLVYNFEIAKSNWLKLGYDLAFLHTPLVNQKLALAGIKKNLKDDWTTENDLFVKLTELVAQMPPPEEFADTPIFTAQTSNKNGTISNSQTFSRRLPVRREPNPEQIAVTQNLIVALQSRTASDEIASWQFNLAFAILKEASLPRDPNEPRKSPDALKSFLKNAPPNLPAEYKTELANLIKIIENTAREKSFDEIRNAVIKLQKLK